MLALLALTAAASACPSQPSLRDPDGELTVLEQNLKFIVTGTRRSERAALLSDWLDRQDDTVDLLLLSEARLTSPLVETLRGWCFYGQSGDGLHRSYTWTSVTAAPPPGGLVVGVRDRSDGPLRQVGGPAGRRFRAAPATLVEGLLGRVFHYQKGWADLEVDGTHLVWSHTQASYRQHPEKGAGGPGLGRWGQFDDLASDLGHPNAPTLLTGDLNLLDRFHAPAQRKCVDTACSIDADTVARFQERTGLDFHWLRPLAERDSTHDGTRAAARSRDEDGARAAARPHDDDDEADGTFLGTIFPHGGAEAWDRGARYDRVGVNEGFKQLHPGTRVRRVQIETAELRVSDHAGLEITIPFRGAPEAGPTWP